MTDSLKSLTPKPSELPQDIIRKTIERIIGLKNHNDVVAGILAKLQAGDRRTIAMFLNENNAVDMDEVTRYAKQHQPRDAAFLVEIAERSSIEL